MNKIIRKFEKKYKEAYEGILPTNTLQAGIKFHREVLRNALKQKDNVAKGEIGGRIDKKIKSEEWGAWKFVSDMLDNPDENGIYPTGKCYEQIYDFVVAQKRKAFEQQRINYYWD